MKTSDAVDYLTNEIDAMLGAGSVGLYEFPQFLRMRFDGLDAEAERQVSRAALKRLISDGRARLVWLFWAGPEPGQDASGVVPPDESWAGLTEEPYLAVEPTPPPEGNQ